MRIVNTLVSMAIIITGIYLAIPYANSVDKKVQRCSAETQGRAENVQSYTETESDSDGDTYIVKYYYAEIKYRPTDDREYTRKITKTQESVAEGESIRVMYNPDDPSETYIAKFEHSANHSRFSGLIAIFMGTLALVLFYIGERRKKQAENIQQQPY